MSTAVVSDDDAATIRAIVQAVISRNREKLMGLVDNEVHRPDLLWKYLEERNLKFVDPPVEFVRYSDVTLFEDQSGYGIDVPLWTAGAPSHVVVRLDVLTSADPHRFVFRTVLAL